MNIFKQSDIPVSQETLNQAVKNLHDYVQNQQRNIQIRVNHDDNLAMFAVMDSKTHEVVRQIPLTDLLGISFLREKTCSGWQNSTGIRFRVNTMRAI